MFFFIETFPNLTPKNIQLWNALVEYQHIYSIDVERTNSSVKYKDNLWTLVFDWTQDYMKSCWELEHFNMSRGRGCHNWWNILLFLFVLQTLCLEESYFVTVLNDAGTSLPFHGNCHKNDLFSWAFPLVNNCSAWAKLNTKMGLHTTPPHCTIHRTIHCTHTNL